MAQSSECVELDLCVFIFVSRLSAKPRISGKHTDQVSKSSLDGDVWDGVRDGNEIGFGYHVSMVECSYGLERMAEIGVI